VSRKTNILVVDDNEEFCQNVADILELEDYVITTAYDGFKAIELVKQNGFDLILMDVRMPVMDGIETFKKIKELVPLIPVIMVTAYAVGDLVREALREGAFGFLPKPLDFDKLLVLIGQTEPNRALVLVVDDDQTICDTMRDFLSEKGYRVSVAYDGDTAVQMTWENNFDIMLIDMNLPPLNGLETYLSIRDIRPGAAVVIITGYSKEMGNLVQRALRENAYTCLEKPIDMDELSSLLEQIKEQRARGMLRKPE